MSKPCPHPSALRIAAQALVAQGEVRTFDAVYRWVCPLCGLARRTTRLADTVYALRHAYGWTIDTHKEDEMLSVYTLTKAGDMPGNESKGPHPRRLVRDHGALIAELQQGGPSAQETAKALLRDAYQNGKPVPVEAIPSPTKWQCNHCGSIVSKPLGQPQLGGYRKARHCQKIDSIFVPVM